MTGSKFSMSFQLGSATSCTTAPDRFLGISSLGSSSLAGGGGFAEDEEKLAAVFTAGEVSALCAAGAAPKENEDEAELVVAANAEAAGALAAPNENATVGGAGALAAPKEKTPLAATGVLATAGTGAATTVVEEDAFFAFETADGALGSAFHMIFFHLRMSRNIL